jgi:hypothetical protein
MSHNNFMRGNVQNFATLLEARFPVPIRALFFCLRLYSLIQTLIQPSK